MTKGKHDSWLIPLCFIIVYVVWGTTYLANAWGVDEVPPIMFAGFRFLVAGSILLLFSSFFQPIKITWAQFKNLSFAGLLLFGIGNGAVTWALQHVDSGITALMIALEPLLVAILLWQLRKERPKANTWVGIGLGILGTMLLFGQPQFISNWYWIIGVICVFTAMSAWGYISIWIATADLPESVFQSAAFQMIIGGIILLATSASMQEMQNFDWSNISSRALVMGLFDSIWVYLRILLFQFFTTQSFSNQSRSICLCASRNCIVFRMVNE